jgi:predicted ATPase with chaperone activity
VLRQPLEEKVVIISRAQGSLIFPASFQLVGAMNPCPCSSVLRRIENNQEVVTTIA